jgi:hypothetical protein
VADNSYQYQILYESLIGSSQATACQHAAKSKTASHYEDKPQFEDEVKDTPFLEIVQTLDLEQQP